MSTYINKELEKDCIDIHLNPKVTEITVGKGKNKKTKPKTNKIELTLDLANPKTKQFAILIINDKIYKYERWDQRELDIELFKKQRKIYE